MDGQIVCINKQLYIDTYNFFTTFQRKKYTIRKCPLAYFFLNYEIIGLISFEYKISIIIYFYN